MLLPREKLMDLEAQEPPQELPPCNIQNRSDEEERRGKRKEKIRMSELERPALEKSAPYQCINLPGAERIQGPGVGLSTGTLIVGNSDGSTEEDDMPPLEKIACHQPELIEAELVSESTVKAMPIDNILEENLQEKNKRIRKLQLMLLAFVIIFVLGVIAVIIIVISQRDEKAEANKNQAIVTLSPATAPSITQSSWRLFTTSEQTESDCLWDVKQIKFFASSDCSTDEISTTDGTSISSGQKTYSSSSNPFMGRVWSGICSNDSFWIGMTFPDEVDIQCIEIQNDNHHKVNSLQVEKMNMLTGLWEVVAMKSEMNTEDQAVNIIQI